MLCDTIESGSEYIDLREVTERLDDLADTDARNEDDEEEYQSLTKLLAELCGQGGDHQWRGDWYPLTLIREDKFEDYARELAEDIHGKELANLVWPFSCIDWKEAADALRMDYSSVSFDGTDYLFR